MNRSRRIRLAAVLLVAAGVLLIAVGGNQTIARGMLVGGLFCAVLHLLIEWRGRGRY